MKKLWLAIKADCKTENSDFKLMFFKCLILAVCIWLGFHWVGFMYIGLLLGLLFSVTQLNARAIYYVMFLYPLMHVFRPTPDATYFVAYIVFAIVLMLFTKYLIQVIRKQRKADYLQIFLFALVIVIFLIPVKNITFSNNISICAGISMLFATWLFRKELSLKELTFIFFAGVLVSVLLGLFYMNNEWITQFNGRYFDHQKRKFQGIHGNPLHLNYDALIILSLFFVLFHKDKIKVIVYPLALILAVIILSTISKGGILLLSVLFLLFVISYLINNKLSKQAVYKVLGIVLLIGVASLIMLNYTLLALDRFSDPSPFGPTDHTNPEGNDFTLDGILTGRIHLWTKQLKEIFSSFISAVFGNKGIVGGLFDGGVTAAHNTYLQALYNVGIFGVLLVGIFIFSLVGKKFYKRLDWLNLYALLILLALFVPEQMLRIGGALMLLPVCFTLFKEPNDSANNVKRSDSTKQAKIPKLIHYVWLGGNPQPKKIQMCIASWKRVMPDYQIKLWDESNVDLDEYEFLRGAYDAKKFGFTVDPLRLHILKQEGGIYLDADVEVIKPLDEFLHHKAFTGLEAPGVVAPGLILAATKDCKFLDDMLEIYKKTVFHKEGQKNEPSPMIFSKYLKQFGFNNDNKIQTAGELTIYPTEYFCPNSLLTNKKEITANTYLIHHYASSWISTYKRLQKIVKWMLNFLTNGLFGKTIYGYVRKKRGLL